MVLVLVVSGMAPVAALATTPSAPTVTSTSHQVGVWTSDSTVDIAWQAPVNPVSAWNYEWSGQPVGGAPEQPRLPGTDTGMTSEPLPDGYRYVYVRYQDQSGAWSDNTRAGPFLIDTLPASPGSLHSDTDHPPGGPPTDKRQIGITWSAASDPLPPLSNYSSGAAGLSWEWSASSSPIVPDTIVDVGPQQGGTGTDPLPDGTWWFYIRAVDNAGNWSATSSIGPFVIAAGPTVTIDSGPAQDSANNPTTVTFTFSTTSAAGLTLQCSVDSAPFATCTSPQTLRNLSIGRHTFSVRLRDADNKTKASQDRTFWVGPPPPPPPTWATPVTVAPAGPQSATSPYAPSVAFAPDGSLHVAYIVPNGDQRGLFYATNKSGTWQSTKIANASTLGDEWTSIVVDGNGRAHVVYQNIAGGVFYLTNQGGSWVSKRLAGGTGLVVYPEIAVGSNNRVHIVYFVPGSSPGLRYATNNSGKWVTKRITKNAFDISADIALDSSGKVHIVYGREHKGYRYITNKTGAWRGGAVLVAQMLDRPPAIDIDSQGRPNVVYLVPNGPIPFGTWTAVKTSAGWSRTMLVSTASLRADIRAGAGGSVSVVAFGGALQYTGGAGSWYEYNAAPDARNGKIAFDIGPGGQMAIVYVRTDYSLGVVVSPAP